jgi:hypothetical protein
MRFILLTLLVSSTFIFRAQLKSELSFSAVKGVLMQNNLYFTSNNYDAYGPYSGVNLKCNSSAGIQVNFQDFIAKSKWYYLAAYDRKWLDYSTTLYSDNYDPNTLFNQVKSFQYQNQIESFSLDFGRRFQLINDKLSCDVNVGLTYRTFDDDQIGTTDPQSFFDTIPAVGDFLYDVKLDYSKMSKMTLNAQSTIKYHLNEQLAFNFLVSFSGRISGVYDMEVTTRIEDEEVSPGVVFVTFESDPYLWLGNVVTNYLNLGVGVTYKF